MEEISLKRVCDLIEKKCENDALDIKFKFYDKNKKYDLVKDVASFANNSCNQDKYIVFGIEDKNWEVTGIDKGTFPDISNLEQLINDNIEPKLALGLDFIKFDNKELGVLIVKKNNTNRPYIIKRDANFAGKDVLHKGVIYIRNGATNYIATRDELDKIYRNKKDVNICLIRTNKSNQIITTLFKKNLMSFEIKIDNNNDKVFDIKNVYLRISVDNSTFVIKECISTLSEISEKDRIFIDEEHSIQVGPNSTIIRWFNFVLSDKIFNILKNKSIELQLIFFSLTDEKMIEIR